jgi:hypothetical protein
MNAGFSKNIICSWFEKKNFKMEQLRKFMSDFGKIKK